MKLFAFKFLTRSGCHLCDEARPLVETAVKRRRGELIELDIDADDTLTRDYGLRVPVLLGPGDVVIAEGRIDRASLRRGMKKLGRSG